MAEINKIFTDFPPPITKYIFQKQENSPPIINYICHKQESYYSLRNPSWSL